MILAGDEFGRTQKGNNNAYCQDNEISWVDWEGIDDDGRALTEFVQADHAAAPAAGTATRTFSDRRIQRGLQVTDAKWLCPSGDELTQEQWDDPSMRCFGLVIDGRAQATGIRRPASDATLLLVLNAHHDVVNFTLPDIPGSDQWSCLIDTNAPIREELEDFDSGDVYQVTGHSVLLFALHARGATRRVFQRLEQELTNDSSPKSDTPNT